MSVSARARERPRSRLEAAFPLRGPATRVLLPKTAPRNSRPPRTHPHTKTALASPPAYLRGGRIVIVDAQGNEAVARAGNAHETVAGGIAVLEKTARRR